MTILSPAHSARIRNRSMGVLHLIAADEGCEYQDILALLSTTRIPSVSGAEKAKTDGLGPTSNSPSQPFPASQAPAARMSDVAPADVQAGEARPASPSTSIDGEDRAKPDIEGCADVEGEEISSRGGPEGVSGSASARFPADALGGANLPGKSVEPSGSAAPTEPTPRGTVPTKAQLVRLCLRDHPDWPASKIAEATGVKKGSVWGLAGGVKVVTEAEYRAAQAAKTVEALKASTPLPPRPGTPAAPKPMAGALPMARTLKDRVREVFLAHPNWTAPAIANYLGANMPSVSTLLAAVRKEAKAAEEASAPVPAQGVEDAIKAEAIARRKRLGAPA